MIYVKTSVIDTSRVLRVNYRVKTCCEQNQTMTSLCLMNHRQKRICHQSRCRESPVLEIMYWYSLVFSLVSQQCPLSVQVRLCLVERYIRWSKQHKALWHSLYRYHYFCLVDFPPFFYKEETTYMISYKPHFFPFSRLLFWRKTSHFERVVSLKFYAFP